MNTSYEQKAAPFTSRMYAQRTAAARRRQACMADGLRHTKLLSLTKGMARVARPCPRESAAKAGKVMRRRVGKVQMQHRWHRRVLCRLLQHAVLCAVFFCCRREWSAKKVLVLWALGRVTAPHAHRTARPTHALHNALREHGLTTAVKHRSHTQQQQQQHS